MLIKILYFPTSHVRLFIRFRFFVFRREPLQPSSFPLHRVCALSLSFLRLTARTASALAHWQAPQLP